MAKPRKVKGPAAQKCNAGPPERPRHSLPWMPRFLASAFEVGDVDSACKAVGISRGVYLRGRLRDPAFDADCAEVDLIERLAARSAVQSSAARGDVRAVRLMRDGFADVGKAVADQAERLPDVLRRILADYRAGRVSSFLIAAIGSAYDLARDLERRGKEPRIIVPDARPAAFSAADVASVWDRRSYACSDCGSIAYRQADAIGSKLATWNAADDARWSGDNGWRCPRCGAMRGLPWSPANRPAREWPGGADDGVPLPPAECHDDGAYLAMIEAKERRLNGGKTVRELSPYHRLREGRDG